MTPWLRKFALTAHIIASVGWLGAVIAFLVLAVAGLTRADTQVVRASYITMGLIGWFAIVPLCFASMVTGIVQSLGTNWGLFRHYWVVIKLAITALSTILLLVHMRPISFISEAATKTAVFSTDFGKLRVQLVADSGAALLALLVTTTLSVYKPQGLTPYGQRKRTGHRPRSPGSDPAI